MDRRITMVCLLALAAMTVAASPGSDGRRGASGDHPTVWTAERRANAIPRDVIVRDALPVAFAKPPWAGGGNNGGDGDGGSTTGAFWTAQDDVASTTGRVFFTLGGVDYACSGSAVDTLHGSVVLTAGHCVHDGNGGAWATNLSFFPGYDNGPGEHGEWIATALFTSAQWASNGDFNNDIGFAVVSQAGSGSLESELGATIPEFSTSTVTDHHAFGYPVQRKFANGHELSYCSGSVSTGIDGSSNLAMSCRMEGGSSGGPWRVTSEDGAPSNVVDTVVSYGYNCCGLKGLLFGPNFDGVEAAVFAHADNGSCDVGERCTAL